MKKLLLSALFIFSALLFNTANAADALKIGIIDMNQVLKNAPLMTSLNDKLSSSFKSRQDTLNSEKQHLQDEVDQLNLKGNTLSTDDRNKLQDKIISDRANVQIADASFQRDLTIAKNKALQDFMTKFNQVIAKIAKDGNYDLIQQRTDMAYVNDKLDITQQVLQQLT